jgi:chromate reductase
MSARLLLLCGSLRAGSVNHAVLATAAELLPPGVTATTYEGLASLPHFNPDDDDPENLHPAVVGLRAQLGSADALLISTPEYAGALPGSFKNLLDWSVGGGEMDREPVAWINASTWATGAEGAHVSLRAVLGYTGSDIVEEATGRIPVPRDAISDGVVNDPALRERIGAAVAALSRAPSPG